MKDLGKSTAEICLELERHFSSANGNIFCSCNIRRTLFDSDAMLGKHHVCLIPLLYYSTDILVHLETVTGSAMFLCGKIPQSTARHHLKNRLPMIIPE